MSGRQMYENAESLKNESDIAEVVSTAWNVELKKLPIVYQVDFAAERKGSIKSLIEVKRRSMNFGQYPDVIMSFHKYLKGRELSEYLGVPFIFVVGLNDGVYWAKMSHKHRVSFGGRTKKTRDSGDVELVVHILMKDFTLLKDHAV